MSGYGFDVRPLIWLGFIVMALIWGTWELIDWLFIDEVIKSRELIQPDIEITVKDNVIDTLYIYRKP